jgi:class 3 adenylate cyclase
MRHRVPEAAFLRPTRDVTCSGCGHPNPPGQKFCNGCGQGLGASAPAATRDPRAYTPKHTALEGERKQVTVLFADVKGSMELAEQLDPEHWHRIMDRFEGTVTQYTGDGIMALFGAPAAGDDDDRAAPARPNDGAIDTLDNREGQVRDQPPRGNEGLLRNQGFCR